MNYITHRTQNVLSLVVFRSSVSLPVLQQSKSETLTGTMVAITMQLMCLFTWVYFCDMPGTSAGSRPSVLGGKSGSRHQHGEVNRLLFRSYIFTRP